MIINLKSNKDGIWFPFFYSHIDTSSGEVIYDDPIEDGPRMRIRNPMSFFKERASARKKTSEFVLNKKTRAMEKITSDATLSADEQKAETADFIDYVIQDIEGFKLDGKEIVCNRQTKLEIMDILLVSMFVHRCIEIMQSEGATEEEIEGKNSQAGLSLKKIKPNPE